MVKAISRHLGMGYQLISVEKRGPGYRIDLLFRDTSGTTRAVEVKSGRRIKEVHRFQASLYSLYSPGVDEVAISNSDQDELLEPEFVQRVAGVVNSTMQFLESNPQAAATRYTPHPDVCPSCANTACPFLKSRGPSISVALS